MTTKRERLEAAVAGQVRTGGRLPIAFWRHFPGDDQAAESLARATVEYQAQWDFDFVKVSPAASYCAEDWGLESRWTGNQEGNRDYLNRPISSPEQWERLPVLDVTKGTLGRSLRTLELVNEGLPAGTPFIWTVFSPLTVLRYLRGTAYITDLRQHPDRVLHALEVVTTVYENFVDAVLDTGAAGIFLAVQPASYQILSEEEYRRFGEPFDRRLLAAAERGSFNLLHAHGDDVMWDLLSTYPVQAINWHDRATPPTLAEAPPRFAGALVGGIKQWETLLQGTPGEVKAEVADAREQVGDRGLIIAAGCVIPVTTPWRNIRAAIDAANNG